VKHGHGLYSLRRARVTGSHHLEAGVLPAEMRVAKEIGGSSGTSKVFYCCVRLRTS
jgi:hypothetical protein